MRNLYKAISSRSLNLEHESVFALILQSIYQIGPDVGRESHLDFQDECFSSEFLKLLEELMELNRGNYSNPVILMGVVLITVRIMDLNKKCANASYQLLRKCREVLNEWSEVLREKLQLVHMENAEETGDKASYQRNLDEIYICSLIIYYGPFGEFMGALKDEEDLAHLLHTLTNRNLLGKESNVEHSCFMKALCNIWKNIAINLGLDKNILNYLFLKKGLLKFVREKWQGAREVESENAGIFKFLQMSNIFILHYFSPQHLHYITVDVFTGNFLVNGYQEAEHSDQISEDLNFQRFFQKHPNFRLKRESATVLTTEYSVHGKNYEFWTREGLVIIEKSEVDGGDEVITKEISDLILVPHEIFRGFISNYFVDNYTHWMNSKRSFVYFQRIAVNDSDYNMPHEYLLQRHEGTKWKLYDEASSKHLLSKKSSGFQMVTDALERLELSEHINVLMNEKDKSITAHIPRQNLRFNLESSRLASVEYPGFHVAQEQSIGTLIGLRNFLLIENGIRRFVVVPHGKIKIQERYGGDMHPVCRINSNELSNPSFFIYEVDEILRRLEGRKSTPAWLYLAALHAATSSTMEDPFTKMTGMEMAISILTSGRVWSCYPYDKESLEILKFIRSLAPIRKFYADEKNKKDDIEKVEWHPGLQSMASFDGYDIVVDKLLEDSLRLKSLYSMEYKNVSKIYEEFETVKKDRPEKLQKRSYLLHLNKYNDAVALNQNFIILPTFQRNHIYSETTSVTLNLREERSSLNISQLLNIAYTRYICDTFRGTEVQTSYLIPKGALVPFIISESPIMTCQGKKTKFSLEFLLDLNFREAWLYIYTTVLTTNDKHKLNLLLSALAYKGAPLEQVGILHYIAKLKHKNSITFPEAPHVPNIMNPTKSDFNDSKIKEILMSHAFEYSPPNGITLTEQQFKANKQKYEIKVQTKCKDIVGNWKSLWPCSKISDEQVTSCFEDYFKAKALEDVNEIIRKWFNGRQLKLFIEEVQGIIDSANYRNLIVYLDDADVPEFEETRKKIYYEVNRFEPLTLEKLVSLDSQIENNGLLRETRLIYSTGNFRTPKPVQSNDRIAWIDESIFSCNSKIDEILQDIRNITWNSQDKNIICLTNLEPRFNPQVLLKCLLLDPFPEWLTSHIGALAVLWTNLKRLKRCNNLIGLNQTSDLERELENPGHVSWSPSSHPEWLLLELELNIMIRKMQVEVALQMMEMPNEGNGVMQLNMGEGKTSVIVPMLCSTLAKDDSLCRVTVLSSIFKMNRTILKFAIGGILNRRLYSIPCKRDKEINEEIVDVIQNVYKECLKLKGTVLTLPEYRLAFRLLAYDNIYGDKTTLGLKILDTENWLREHARDILDESDELLAVKYQLIYTIGSQATVDGGSVRWTLCQKILEFVQDIGGQLSRAFGTDAMEFKRSHLHEFSKLRLLDGENRANFLDRFENLVVKRFLDMVLPLDTNIDDRELCSNFILQKDIPVELHDLTLSKFRTTPEFNQILIFSGYIRRNILNLALTKRWRVEYGVDPKGHRLMAVPFRAKDVAAEKTEFGHPDLAIILTYLSYYYQGLSEEQLIKAFEILGAELDPEAVYADWIGRIQDFPESLMSYHNLNLKDTTVRQDLFTICRKHKSIIDYWLHHVVFPKEAKLFPGKLVMTAWDLVYERHHHPTTGFSGTNDSKILLPLTISQQDLPQLQLTNVEMERVLQQPENMGHRDLRVGISCEEILEIMNQDRLRILIDAGALMLDCSNEQVANLWLQVDEGLEATVYFNEHNELMVKSRNNTTRVVPDIPFELSCYQGNLQNCGVFLDDQHTRGTDLKFPLESRACVTIGSRMKREKLIQACMRMRQLGRGQSLTFYLSNEAANNVRRIAGNEILDTASVLTWVQENTTKSNEEGLLYWSMAGKNYAQKLTSEDLFHHPMTNATTFLRDETIDTRAITLSINCMDKEITSLIELYGQHTRMELLTELIPQWFSVVYNKLDLENGPPDVSKRFNEILANILDRCLEHAPNLQHFTCTSATEEEQEKELEVEKEIEEVGLVERPPKCEPVKHSVHPNVIMVLNKGVSFDVMDGIKPLSNIFMNTTYSNIVQPECWGVEVYVTQDFISVINVIIGDHGRNQNNSFLRPVEYMASLKRPADGTKQFLILSPYEVNEMLPFFRRGDFNCALHMLSVRRFNGQDILVNRCRLQLPSEMNFNVRHQTCVVDEGSREMAAILIAFGNLYFKNVVEQESFAQFLSLSLRPWSPRFTELLRLGRIRKTGFRLPQFPLVKTNGFWEDPTSLVRMILASRYPSVHAVAHVLRLLDGVSFIPLEE